MFTEEICMIFEEFMVDDSKQDTSKLSNDRVAYGQFYIISDNWFEEYV